MADEFTVESRTTEAIKVRHVVYGHRYTFRVWDHPRHRMLRAGLVQRNRKASLPVFIARPAEARQHCSHYLCV
ncbi:hypothetical protein SAMN05519103_03973 [Rhizobiales bacterium GAS113]|nr:hypothetical protein SAMN05519103_03973 [Rhizobiales bacterium GAS113]